MEGFGSWWGTNSAVSSIPSFLFSEVQTRGKQEVEDFVPPVVALRRLCLLVSGFG